LRGLTVSPPGEYPTRQALPAAALAALTASTSAA